MIEFYNTLAGQLEEFTPLQPGTVKMYTCGPTVYDYFHIGNARPFIVFDGLRRYLEFRGYDVHYVQNITDVEDKIINRARKENLKPGQVAQKYTAAYLEDLDRLGISRPDQTPKVTEVIGEIIEHVKALQEDGYAYERDGDVYFRIHKFQDYGKLSGQSREEMESGARVTVDDRKERPLDFALWKKSAQDEPGWDSPWGRGRPGWHIECSVMAIQALGQTIDIHAGGSDLIFPHHENEIAQSEAKTGEQFVNYWLHNGLLQFKGEKMSKSEGNFEYAREVLDRYDAETVRLFYFSTHYRKPLDYSEKNLQDAQKSLERIYNFLEEIESRKIDHLANDNSPVTERGQSFSRYLSTVKERFTDEVDKDFNTPGGLGVLFELLKKANQFRQSTPTDDQYLLKQAAQIIRSLGEPLGLFQKDVTQNVQGKEETLVELLIEIRTLLREKEHWKLADKIRSRLDNLGIQLKDTASGTTWVSKDD